MNEGKQGVKIKQAQFSFKFEQEVPLNNS